MRRARIVATLGPALDDPEVLKQAIAAGIDVVRLNFSHGSKADHAKRLDNVRRISAELGRTIGVLGDLQGPKIRLGVLPDEGVLLADDAEVVLHAGEHALSSYDEAGVVHLPVVYEYLAKDVDPGAMILINDGLLRLEVLDVDADRVRCRVVVGGLATSRKGVNLPGSEVSASALTSKDVEDVATMVELGVDWIALSFVRRAADLRQARDRIAECGGDQLLMAKLERPEAVANLEQIMDEADAVMVARGDLGVEIGPERVPPMQKRMIDMANAKALPVVTATEMLDSMVRAARPTRAEASDVANAVLDGTDAVMLSAETAAGRHPVEAVRTMARIIETAESTDVRYHTQVAPPPPDAELMRVVADAAVRVAEQVHATAIIVMSNSGRSARLVSKSRPTMPIIGLTPKERTITRMSLFWGLTGRIVGEYSSSRELLALAERTCLDNSFADKGDTIVVVSGVPGHSMGTNRLLVHRLGDAIDLG